MSLKTPKAEIIAIGSEFLHGGRVESNSIFVAAELAGCGVEVRWKTLVGDKIDDISSALFIACKRARVVVLTGGLGSTLDDCTREAIVKLTGKPLRCRTKALKALKIRYAASGRPLTKRLSRQAYLPLGAEMLENPVGSAPGFLLEWKGSLLIALPGVSREAQAMLESQIVPCIGKRVVTSRALRQRILTTVGLTEVEIDRRLQPIIQEFPTIELSLLASTLGVSVVLREWTRLQQARVESRGIEALLPSIRRVLGESIYAEDNQLMEEIIGQLLQASSNTLALAESCTGGLIGHRLTQVPGSSSYLERGLVCYSNQAKQDLLGVPKKLLQRHGAVSRTVAKAMAIGVRTRSHTDLGLSVTGIAGPGGGTVKKPVGLVFMGIDGPNGSYTKTFKFYGERPDIKMRASQAALNMLRLYLLGKTNI